MASPHTPLVATAPTWLCGHRVLLGLIYKHSAPSGQLCSFAKVEHLYPFMVAIGHLGAQATRVLHICAERGRGSGTAWYSLVRVWYAYRYGFGTGLVQDW